MIREAIGEASTVEEATKKAKEMLSAPLDADVKLDVIALPQKKFLGLFGGSPAKVRAYYDDGKKQEESREKAVKNSSKEKAPQKKAVKNVKPEKKAETAQPKTTEKLSEKAISEVEEYISAILVGLKVEGAKITSTQESDALCINIECDDYGIIIGRRGETLDSIQYLVSFVVNKYTQGYKRVSINVGDYREKREETLRHVARKNAQRVLRTGRRVVLEPMNPYERRIIHTTVQEIEGVTSRSVGSNNDRKVVIELAEGFKPTGEKFERRRPSQNSHAAQQPPRKLDKSEKPKFGKIE